MRSLRGCSQLCARRARWGARRAPRGGVRRVRIGCRQHTCRNRRARRARGVGTRASTPSWVAYRAVRAQPEAQRARDGVGGLPALRDGSESTSVRVDARGLRRFIHRRQPAWARGEVPLSFDPPKKERVSTFLLRFIVYFEHITSIDQPPFRFDNCARRLVRTQMPVPYATRERTATPCYATPACRHDTCTSLRPCK